MKLGIYCRISRTKDGNDLSIPDQKQKGIDKARELSLSYEFYIDEGISGATDNIEDRPQLERMLSDIAGRKITAVYAYDQSRIERNPQIRFAINDIFKQNSIKLYTEFDGLVDLDNPQTEFFGDIMSVINKYHVTMTKVKVKSALRNRVKSGKAHSIVPYGYTKNENGELIIDEEESKIVQEIYDMSFDGIGTRSIAFQLNERGILTRYNKLGKGTIKTKNKYTGTITETNKKDINWSGNTVRGIIRNTLYKGERKYSNEIYPVPAIISSSYWEKVNKNLDNNRNNSGKKVEHKYLLKGLIRCGVCGRNMYGRTREDKSDNYYMCSSKRIKGENCGNRSINIDKLEALIWDRFFKSADFLNRLKQKLKPDDTKLKKLNNDLLLVENKIEQLKKEKKRAIELVIKGILSEEDVKNIIDNTDRKVSELEIKKQQVNQELLFLKNSNQLLKKYEDDFEEISQKTSFAQKKKIINEFIKNIVVKFDHFENTYSVDVEFNVKVNDEEYLLSKDFKEIMHKGDPIIPRSVKRLNFRLPTVIDGKNGITLGGDDSPPYEYIQELGLVQVHNTRVPFGDVNEWTNEEIKDFIQNNPDWYCKESGVSLWSKNESLPSYEIAKTEYQKELSKKK